MADNTKLLVTPGPHISKPLSTRSVMLDVIIGLTPAIIMSILYFRNLAVILLGTCVLACMTTELLCNIIRKQRSSIGDLTAMVTGIILALSLPPKMPISMAIIGSIFTIAIGKMVFGGLGANPFNPAMAGRAFLTACFGVAMTTWTVPATTDVNMPQIGADGKYTAQTGVIELGIDAEILDATTQATPQQWAKNAIKTKNETDKSKVVTSATANSMIKALLWGNTGGCLGETSGLALIIGGIYLLIRKTISWQVPAAVLAAAGIFATICWLSDKSVYAQPHFHLLSGGMLICAFFIATDPVTIPMTNKGMLIFGCGVGLLIMLIRQFGGYPEGVMYAVLIMNAFTPMIDRICKPVPFGGIPGGK